MAATIEFDVDSERYIYVTKHSETHNGNYINYSIGLRKTIGDIDGFKFSTLENLLNKHEENACDLRFHMSWGSNTKPPSKVYSTIHVDYESKSTYLDSWFHTVDTPNILSVNLHKDIKNFISEYFNIDESEK
jgi:hypothetical protein